MDYKTVLHEIIKLGCEEIEIIRFENIGNDMNFVVKGKNRGCICPKCKLETTKRKDLKIYEGDKPMKHICLSDERMICIIPQRRHFLCGNCGKDFMETFSFEAEKGKHTKAFETYVIGAWGVMAGSEIGKRSGCSSAKIHKILCNIDADGINKAGLERMRSAERIYLGIDEHSFRGRDYVLVITDIRERVPLAVLTDNKIATIEKRMSSLPNEVVRKIDGVANDMHRGYKNVIEKSTRKDLGVVDKFHLFQEANKMVDEVRKINNRLVKMNVVEGDDFIKNKKVPKDVQLKPEDQKQTVVHSKYKGFGDIKILDETTITPQDRINKKGEIIEFQEITLLLFQS